jgi:hypothetical protein
MVTYMLSVVRPTLAVVVAQQLVITVMIFNMTQLALMAHLVAARLMIRHFLVALSQMPALILAWWLTTAIFTL